MDVHEVFVLDFLSSQVGNRLLGSLLALILVGVDSHSDLASEMGDVIAFHDGGGCNSAHATNGEYLINVIKVVNGDLIQRSGRPIEDNVVVVDFYGVALDLCLF